MGRKISHCTAAAMCFLIMNACATTSVKSVWRDPSYEGGPLKKVLVIAVFENQLTKEYFENELVRELKARDVDAIPGYTVLTEEQPPDEKTIIGKIKELGIDSAFITTVVSAEDRGRYETHPLFASETGFFGYYYFCCQHIVTLGYDVILESKIFDIKSDKVIWSALSETAFQGSLVYTLNSFFPAIIRNLQHSHLIR
jgi:hypothetical protein